MKASHLFGVFRHTSFLLLVVAVSSRASSAFAENWPQFRGPQGNGSVAGAVPVTWDAKSNVRWKIPMNGEGWSCPVVWGQSVFVTAAVPADGSNTTPSSDNPSFRGGGYRSDLTSKTFQWEVICIDAGSGKIRWRNTARTGKPSLPRHGLNTYATETPITDGERVYAYFGMTGLFCYSMDGKLLWNRDLGSYRMRAGWGTSSSPVLLDGRLFLQVDNEEQSFLVAIDAVSGEQLWRVNRSEPSQYSSPIIWKNSLRNELIVGGQFYRSYDPATGKLLWELNMDRGRSSATPLAAGDRLYVGTELRNRGGSDDGGGYLFSIKPGGSGDISLPSGKDSSDVIQWRIRNSGIQMASPVLCAGKIYLLERRSSILHCVDAETGQSTYRKRIPDARAFWASPWTSGDMAFCLDSDGTTHVLAGGPEFKVLRTNELQEQTWSSPAVANGALYLRSTDHLFCIMDQSATPGD